jgi:hypothetical protein
MSVRSNSIASIVLAGALGAGCQLLVTFETVDEGGGGGATTTTTTTAMTDCDSAADCDEGNPCTADTCESGLCVHSPTNEGVAQNDFDLQDCKIPVCHGGVITDDPAPTQTPAPSPDGCSTWSCNGSQPTSMPINEGGSCDLQSADPCVTGVCSSGVCAMQNQPDGTVVDPGDTNLATGAGDCRDVVCNGGTSVLQPNFLNCADTIPGNCNIRLCGQDGLCGALQAAPAGTPCDSNGDGMFDSVCDGAGSPDVCP